MQQKYQKWLTLLAVACGTFMATLDASIVNVALPSITGFFGSTINQSRWVIIAYLFSITGLLLFFGKIADLINRKFIFVSGFAVFSLGSFVCGLATSIQQLILFRALQGVGAAMLMANGPAIITAAFPGNERGQALGILSMAVSIGLAIGPTLGGVLVNYFGWPSIFFVNIPIGVTGFILVSKYIPTLIGMATNDKAFQESLEREQKLPFSVRFQMYMSRVLEMDWIGGLLWLVLQIGLILGIDRENLFELDPLVHRIILFGTFGLAVLFLIWEASTKEPLLDLSLFKTRIFLTANLSAIFNFIAFSSVTLLMPFYLQNVRMLSPDQVGLYMTAIPLTTFCIAPLSGRWSDKYGSRVLSTLGMTIMVSTVGMLALPWQGLHAIDLRLILIYLVLIGMGLGLFQSPNNNAIMSSVSMKRLGVASAMLATVRNLGIVLGTAISSHLLTGYHEYFAARDSSIPDLVHFVWALRYTFLSVAAITSLGVISCLFSKAGKTDAR